MKFSSNGVHSDLKGARVAIVHDFLYCYGGAERVLEQILKVVPDADLFSLFDFLPENDRGFILNKPVQSSFLQRMPGARKNHRHFLPLMPIAVEQLDVTDYDIVISSSYLAAKGVITRPDQLHICYCHSPIRVAWDMQHQYLAMAGLNRGLRSVITRMILHYIRMWDVRSANSVDKFITNSRFVARRIKTVYRRESEVVYPPVDIDRFALREDKEDFYLTVSRLVPYKRIDLLVDAFAKMPDKRLVVIGEGPGLAKMKAKARGCPNIQMLGYQSFENVVDHMQRAKAFLFAAEEDFGIVAAEAQACGTPVIAYGRGGATESVAGNKTGVFFAQQTAESIIDTVHTFENHPERWDSKEIRHNAERFSAPRFRKEFAAIVENEWTSFHAEEPGDYKQLLLARDTQPATAPAPTPADAAANTDATAKPHTYPAPASTNGNGNGNGHHVEPPFAMPIDLNPARA